MQTSEHSFDFKLELFNVNVIELLYVLLIGTRNLKHRKLAMMCLNLV